MTHEHCRSGEGAGTRPPARLTLLPWLLLGMGAFSNLFRGEASNPWIGGLGLLAFNSLYIYVTVRSFLPGTRESLSTRVALGLLAAATCALGLGYGGSWLLFFPLLGLATGAAVRMPRLRVAGAAVTVLAGVVCVLRDGWGGLDTVYATAVSAMVTAAILSLSDAVRELRAAREELARRAVEEERLRFSRDLHDLLGHTLSVIVVKSEAARRLAPRDVDAAVLQITDIESVGRQALTEIREAVTGYRAGGLATELDRARSALTAAGITVTLDRPDLPLPPRTEALLGWVVREATTNVLRHSGAHHCAITLSRDTESVRLRVSDDGHGGGPASGPVGPGNSPAGPRGARVSPTREPAAPTVVGPAGGLEGRPEGSGERHDGPGRRSDGRPGRPGTRPAGGRGGGGTAVGGTGLPGLSERISAAGGTLGAEADENGGFTVTAELPAPERELAATASTLPRSPAHHLREHSSDTPPTGSARPTLGP
ncbi:sensor histidine kinase [Streptomyces sp. NPDC003832]